MSFMAFGLILMLSWVVAGLVSSYIFVKGRVRASGVLSTLDRSDAVYIFLGGLISFSYYLIKLFLVKPFCFVVYFGERRGKSLFLAEKKQRDLEVFLSLPEHERQKQFDKAIKELDRSLKEAMKLG